MANGGSATEKSEPSLSTFQGGGEEHNVARKEKNKIMNESEGQR